MPTAPFMSGDMTNDWSDWSDSNSRGLPSISDGVITIVAGGPVGVQRPIHTGEVMYVGPAALEGYFKVIFRASSVDRFTSIDDAYTFANLLASGLGGWAS